MIRSHGFTLLCQIDVLRRTEGGFCLVNSERNKTLEFQSL